jgi:hypothetical protein
MNAGKNNFNATEQRNQQLTEIGVDERSPRNIFLCADLDGLTGLVALLFAVWEFI